jgi:threonine/homoserine/homoserine lactone efflux protein
MLTEAMASGGPQLVAVQVGTSWGVMYFGLVILSFLVFLVVLNYKSPQTFTKLIGAMTLVYLACERAAINLVVSIKTFKARRKAEQAKTEPTQPVDYPPLSK